MVELASRSDLNLIHHALRMLIQHPMTDAVEATEMSALADACWDESVTRTERGA